MGSQKTFRLADLVSLAGVGANGETLVRTLDHQYPPGLQAAQVRRRNDYRTGALTDEHYAAVAKLAGVDRIEHMTVRGATSDAWLTYAYVDDRGDVMKGALPLDDLRSGSSDRHISQTASLMASPAARDQREALEKACAVAPVTPAPDPFVALSQASEVELVAQMTAHPERAAAVKAFELATRGDAARAPIVNFNEGGA
jgi:hypothetical protein